MSGETPPRIRMSGTRRLAGKGAWSAGLRMPWRGTARIARIAAATVLPLLACACSVGAGDPPADAAAKKPPPPATPYGVEPLTGRPATSEAAAKRPILAVAVRAGGKTTGLDSADFVYYEAGSKRLVALYQSKPPAKVGPVTQTRPFDAKMLPPTRAIVATSGGPDKFLRQLRRTKGITNLPASSYEPGYSRGFAVTRNLYRKKPKDVQAPPRLAQYAQPGQLAGAPATRLTVDLPGRDEVWTYDANGKAWRRKDGPEFAAANVVVQLARFKKVALEKTGGSVPTAKPYGKGPATAVSVGPKGGELSVGTWRKPGTYELTLYSAGRGKPMLFTPGPTWVIIAPIGTKIRTE